MKNAEGVTINIDDDQYYEITLNWAVTDRGQLLSPRVKNIVKGHLLKTWSEDAIADVKPV